jgi:hypothetical protein
MSNLAESTLYAHKTPEIEILHPPLPPKKKNRKEKPSELSAEDQQIVGALKTVKDDLDNLHNRYDQITDPILMESIIYELKAANLRFVYYLNLCKDRGICSRFEGRGN